MTKLKNTKKGMAKKALSVSLVAAMLATSNVPVWAAEELFSDGSASVVVEPNAGADVFSDNADTVSPVTEDASVADNSAVLADGKDMTEQTDFSGIDIVTEMNGSVKITGQIIKDNGDPLQKFSYVLSQNGKILAQDTLQDSAGANLDITIGADQVSTGTATLTVYREDQYKFNKEITFTIAKVTDTNYTWNANGAEFKDGIAYDAGTISVVAALPRALANGETASIRFEEETGKTLTGNFEASPITGNTLTASYTLSKEDIGKHIVAVVTVSKNGVDYISHSASIEVTDAYITLTGRPVIEVKSGEAEVRPGVTLTANVSGISAPSNPGFTDFSYQWQRWDADKKEWVNITGAIGKDYVVTTDDYDTQLQVAVFGGDYYTAEKSVFPEKSVSVVADDLEETNVEVIIDTDSIAPGIQTTKEFNPLDSEANKLVDNQGNSQITIRYNHEQEDNSHSWVPLTAGTDYTLKYEGNEQIGFVTVTITILPTEKTNYSSGTIVEEDCYELTAPDENDSYVITSGNTSSEYNGEAAVPGVTVETNIVPGTGHGTILAPNTYKVYSVGPDAGTYDINVYVNGQGMAVSGKTHTINPKNINNHTEDFNLVIPDAVWDASETAVESNAVTGAKMKLFDNAVSETDDLLVEEAGNYTIEALNWGEGGVKKSIRITFYGTGNYRGSLTVEGEVDSRSIAQFDAQFTTTIKAEAGARVYNGLLQDVLGQIIDSNDGYIEFSDGTKLYEGRDFVYEIVKGGTNVGDVSIYIEGRGNYDGNTTLSNVYSITKANFRYDVAGSDDFTVTYDPSLGDEGADISAYIDLARSMYSAEIISSGYDLTLDKDFWLDQVSSASNWNTLWFKPTVAENKVEGHGENPNFVTTGYEADKDLVNVELVRKNLNDSDIQVTVESAEYNGGNLVTPKVKVAFVKDGKEYVINPAYYDVKIVQSAYDQGETGKVNIVAKTALDTQKYPQLYTGNQMVDYTVGKTNLALGKIVATTRT